MGSISALVSHQHAWDRYMTLLGERREAYIRFDASRGKIR